MPVPKNGRLKKLVEEGVPEPDLDAGGGKVHITPLNEEDVTFLITGTCPYVQLKFSAKSREKLAADMQAGERAKLHKRKEPRDFKQDYENAVHRMHPNGEFGIPAMAIKGAMVSAAKLCGLPMTRAKILFNVVEDGYDMESGDPLVRIIGEPQEYLAHVRNATGVVDLRMRALFKNWSAKVTIRYDRSCMGSEDVYHLLYRAGAQVGIGEGRPDSRKSCGLGMGKFNTVAYLESEDK